MIWQIVWLQLVSNSMCLPENSLQAFLEISFFCHNDHKSFLRCTKPAGFRISADCFTDNLYALPEINPKTLVSEAVDAGFKGKWIAVWYPNIHKLFWKHYWGKHLCMMLYFGSPGKQIIMESALHNCNNSVHIILKVVLPWFRDNLLYVFLTL